VVIGAFSRNFGLAFAVAGVALLRFSLSLALAVIGLLDITQEIRKPPGAANRRSSTGVQYRVLPSLLFIWGSLSVPVPLVLKAAYPGRVPLPVGPVQGVLAYNTSRRRPRP
jgi:hypothetical protein